MCTYGEILHEIKQEKSGENASFDSAVGCVVKGGQRVAQAQARAVICHGCKWLRLGAR